MRSIKQIRIEVKAVVLPIILTTALAVRVITALNMDIVYDEISYVYWIGSWFSKHFPAYFFQFQHVTYPPRSPIFANPPLGIWLLTIGIRLCQNTGHSILLGARFTNVIMGVIVCLIIYLMGRRLFDEKIGLFAAFMYALSPAAVAADARAYLDTALSLFTLLTIYFFYLYIQKGQRIHFVSSSAALGLALLTKFTACCLWLNAFLVCHFHGKEKSKPCTSNRRLLIYGAMSVGVPVFLWAGLRDIDHIYSVISYRFGFSKPLLFPFDVLYPGKLFFFQITTIAACLLSLSLFAYAICAIGKKLDFRRVFLMISFLTTLFSVWVFASTFHMIVPVLPYMFLLISDTVFSLSFLRMPDMHVLQKIPLRRVVVLLVLLSQPVAFFSTRLGYAGMYTNLFYVPLSEEIRVGDGEGMREAAEWVSVNIPRGWKIDVMGNCWLLHYYLTDGDTEWNNYPDSDGWVTISDVNSSLHVEDVLKNYDCFIIHSSYLRQDGPLYDVLKALEELYGKPDLIVYSDYCGEIAVRGYIISTHFNGGRIPQNLECCGGDVNTREPLGMPIHGHTCLAQSMTT